jgi:hypothetical protein
MRYTDGSASALGLECAADNPKRSFAAGIEALSRSHVRVPETMMMFDNYSKEVIGN